MNYRAVGRLCAVSITDFNLPISQEETLTLLTEGGFKIVNRDLIAMARECVGTSLYRRSARLRESPSVVNCSQFTRWLFSHIGVWLPRRAIEQRDNGAGVLLTSSEFVCAGDLVFSNGRDAYYHDRPGDGVGHVGIATADASVVCASRKAGGVHEVSLAEFYKDGFRGVRRVMMPGTLTFLTPQEAEIETSNDVGWWLRERLPK